MDKVVQIYDSTVSDIADMDAKDSTLSRDITNDNLANGRWSQEDRAILDAVTLKSLFYSDDWVFIICDLIANKISNQFLRVMKQVMVEGKQRIEPAENHLLQTQLERPNNHQDYHSWMYSLVVDLVLIGNSIQWKRQTERQLLGIPAEAVSLDFTPSGTLKRYLAYDMGNFDETNQRRRVMEFQPEEIIHLRRPNPSSLMWGLSPFIPGQKSILFNRYSQEYLNSFYLKGATPGMVLTMENEANEANALRMLRSFEMAYTGRRNQRRTMILPKGVKSSTVTHSLADQRLDIHTEKNRENILALLKVPKHEVGLQASGSLGSEEHKTALKNFWAATLKPLMRTIAGGLTLAYERELGERYFLEFDLSDVDILQDDRFAKANLATAMKQTRTLNEIREEVWEVEPISGGDALPGTVAIPHEFEATTIPDAPSQVPTTDAVNSDTVLAPQAAANQVTSTTQSLNGAQVSSMIEVVNQVANGTLPRGTGIAIIRVAFALSQADAEEIMGDAGSGFKPSLPSTEADSTQPVVDEQKDVTSTDDNSKGIERVDTLIKNNSSWFEKREQTIKRGVDRTAPKLMKQALERFGNQAVVAVRLVNKFLEDEKNFSAASFKSDGVGRRRFKAAEIKNRAQLRKRLQTALNQFTKQTINKYVDALVATVELGYDSAINLPFNLPSKDEMAALRKKGAKQRRATLEERGLRTFANIDDATTDEIMGVIDRGVAEGKSVNQIAKDIANRFRDIENIGSRAQVIARTETLTAVSLGQAAAMNDAAKVIPNLKKMWINSGDSRVRGNPDGTYKSASADHWSLQGEVQPYDSEFKNGLQFPRDPKGPPEETIQCRCTWIMLPEDQMQDMSDNLEADQTPYERGERDD